MATEEYLCEASEDLYVLNADDITRQKCRARQEALLRQEKAEQKISKLTSENAALSQKNASLVQEKEALAQENNALAQEIATRKKRLAEKE